MPILLLPFSPLTRTRARPEGFTPKATVAENIKKHLEELEKDPFRPRAACDIDIVAGSGRPPMYRLRMGEFRAMYFVENQAVYVTDLFPKKRDSAYRQN
jgi:mRNA-degrading endonuclease RelE of RelBE toxin-antitoxin system